MKQYQGSCHCGAVQFSFEDEEIKSALRCNCSLCLRKGAQMSTFVLSSDQLKIDADPAVLGLYQFGQHIAKHYFCKNCGVYTFHETLRAPGHYRINLGCIEGLDASTLATDLFDGKHLI